MSYYVMLTQLSHNGVRSPKSLVDLEKRVVKLIRSECPSVKWLHNFAVLGPYDYLDIFSAPDAETAFRVATLIRTYGRAHTEVWTAEEWGKFKKLARDLPD